MCVQDKISREVLGFGRGVIRVSSVSEYCEVLVGSLLLTIGNNISVPSLGVKQPKKNALPLNVRITRCPETSVTNCQPAT